MSVLEGIAPEFVTPTGGSALAQAPTVSLVPVGAEGQDGIRLALNAEGWGYQLDEEATGLASIGVEVSSKPLGSGGSVFRHDRLESGDMFLPVHLVTPVPSTMGELFDRLVGLMQPGRSRMVEVRVYDPYSQETRSRAGVVSEVSDPVRKSAEWWTVGVTVEFFDPFWYGMERSIGLRLGALRKKFLTASEGSETVGPYTFPFFPVMIGSSYLQNEHTFTVQGDASAHWQATVQGPGEDLTITNRDGEQFHIQGRISEPIFIDTAPRSQMVRTIDGTPVWDKVPLGKDKMFPLEPGENTLKIELANASLQSRIDFTYREPFYHPFRKHSGGYW